QGDEVGRQEGGAELGSRAHRSGLARAAETARGRDRSKHAQSPEEQRRSRRLTARAGRPHNHWRHYMNDRTLVYDPTAPTSNAPRGSAPALDGLAGKVVGFIDNAKPNFHYLVDDLAELLTTQYGVA